MLSSSFFFNTEINIYLNDMKEYLFLTRDLIIQTHCTLHVLNLTKCQGTEHKVWLFIMSSVVDPG